MSLNKIETTDFTSPVPEGEYNFDKTIKELDNKNDPELEAAKNIIEQGGNTNEIKKLDASLAALLVSKQQGKDSLGLAGLTSLDADTARELAKFDGISLELPGLTSLDADTARQLAKFDGKYLVLTGLDDISDGLFNLLKDLFILNKTISPTDRHPSYDKYLVFNVNLYAKFDEKNRDQIIINDYQYKHLRIKEAVKNSYKMPYYTREIREMTGNSDSMSNIKETFPKDADIPAIDEPITPQ